MLGRRTHEEVVQAQLKLQFWDETHCRGADIDVSLLCMFKADYTGWKSGGAVFDNEGQVEMKNIALPRMSAND